MSIVSIKVLRALLFLFFILPFVFLFSFHWPQWPLPAETFTVISYTFLQALFSAMVSLAFGLIAAFGFAMDNRKPSAFNLLKISLLPNYLPTLLVLISAMSSSFMLSIDLKGMLGIVVVQSIINIGVVSVILTTSIKQRAISCLELVFVEGAKPLLWIPSVLKVLRDDLYSIFLFVFFMSFTSFSIPLVLGDGLQTTIEVFAYEQIKIHREWGVVSSLVLIELVVLYLISFLRWSIPPQISSESRGSSLWGADYLKWLALFPLLIITVGFVKESFVGFLKLSTLYAFISEIMASIPWTFFISLTTAFFIFMLLVMIISVFPVGYLGKFIYGVGAPSSVLVGYSLVAWGTPNSYLWVSLLISLALTFVFLPPLYRLLMANRIEALKDMIFVAETMSASRTQILKEIVFPQLLPQLILASQLAAFWACGEFALSSLLANDSFTLPLILKDLMQSYYLHLAAILIWIVLLIGLINYFLLKGVGIVISYWLNKKV